MPKKLERKLKLEAAMRGYGEDRANAYVYGTLRKTGWRPKRERQRHQPGRLERALYP